MERLARTWLWGPSSARGLGAAAVTALADQGSKAWLLDVYGLAGKGRVPVLSFLDFVYVVNPGISYGLIPQGSATGQIVLVLFAVAASLVLTVWIAGTGRVLTALSLGLILGGAVGNAIDRVRFGGVSDFVLLHAGALEWYVFNLADAAIVAGVIGLLYESLVGSRNDAAKQT